MMNAKTWLEAASKVDYGVSMIVKAEGPSGRAKIRSDDPKHAFGALPANYRLQCLDRGHKRK
jgi:hypothetical protein